MSASNKTPKEEICNEDPDTAAVTTEKTYTIQIGKGRDIGKWILFVSLLDSNYTFICIVCVIFSFIGAIYYLRLVKIIYFDRNIFLNGWKKICVVNNISEGFFILAPVIYISSIIIIKPTPFFLFLSSFNF